MIFCPKETPLFVSVYSFRCDYVLKSQKIVEPFEIEEYCPRMSSNAWKISKFLIETPNCPKMNETQTISFKSIDLSNTIFTAKHFSPHA
jgi:hypothetical protein